MANADPKFYSGHRERLRQKFLGNKLAEYEKLEMLLGYAVPRRDVRPLAHALLRHFGSLPQVLGASYENLIAFPGVGPGIAIFLKLVNDIIMCGYRDMLATRPVFHKIENLYNYCKWNLANKTVEEFHVLYLDDKFRLIQDQTHSVGTVDSSSVYVREIVKRALELNAKSVVLVHNHPVSNDGFSTMDMDATAEVQRMLKNVGVTVFDHLLVDKFTVSSARGLGYMHD